MQRQRGALGTSVMNALWNSPDGATGNEVREAIAEPRPALTTVLTVLDRLRDKGLVHRDKQDSRGYRYFATIQRDETIVDSMVKSLTESTDRSLTLLNFAGNLTDDDRAILRRALDGK